MPPKPKVLPDKKFKSKSQLMNMSEFGSLYIKYKVLMDRPTIFNRLERLSAYRVLARKLNTTPSVIKQWEKIFRKFVLTKLGRGSDNESNVGVPGWFQDVAQAIKLQEEDSLQVPSEDCSPAGAVVLALCNAARRRGSLCSACTYMDVKRVLRNTNAHTSHLHQTWIRIQRVCMRALWASARLGDVTRRGDVTGAPAPRPARLVADLVLLHSDVTTQRLLTPDSAASCEESAALYLLWRLVLQHGVEGVPPGDVQRLAHCWTWVWKDYRDSGRVASIIVLQRRWHELKLQARHIILSYWRYLKYIHTQQDTHTDIQSVTIADAKQENDKEMAKLDDDIKPHVWNSDFIKEQIVSSAQTFPNNDVLPAQDVSSSPADISNAQDVTYIDMPSAQVLSNNESCQVTPNASNVTSMHPTPLHLDILDKYPAVATASMMSWEQMLADEIIVCDPLSEDKGDSDMECSESSDNETERKWRVRKKCDLFAGLDEEDDIPLRAPERASTDQTNLNVDDSYSNMSDSDTEPALQIVEDNEATIDINLKKADIKSESNKINIELELISSQTETIDSVRDIKNENIQKNVNIKVGNLLAVDTQTSKNIDNKDKDITMETTPLTNMAPINNKSDGDVEMKTLKETNTSNDIKIDKDIEIKTVNLTNISNINEIDQKIYIEIPTANNVSPNNNEINKDIQMETAVNTYTPKINTIDDDVEMATLNVDIITPTGKNINKDIKMETPNVTPSKNTKAEIATNVKLDLMNTNAIDDAIDIIPEVTNDIKIEDDIGETVVVHQNNTNIVAQIQKTAVPITDDDIKKEPDKVTDDSIVKVLNVIDPTSIRARLLFDSDSDTENQPYLNDNKDEIQLAIKQEETGSVRDRLKFSDELDEDDVINDDKKVKVERVGESSFRPGIVVDVDMDEPGSAEIVRKLLLDARVELQRIDPDIFWKVYKSGSLNISDIDHKNSSEVKPPIDTNTSKLQDIGIELKSDVISQQTLLSHDSKYTLNKYNENQKENLNQSSLQLDQVENNMLSNITLYPSNIESNYNINIQNQIQSSLVVVPNYVVTPYIITPYSGYTLQNTFQSNMLSNVIIYPENATPYNTINQGNHFQSNILPNTMMYPGYVVSENENHEGNHIQGNILPNITTYPGCVVSEIENHEENHFHGNILPNTTTYPECVVSENENHEENNFQSNILPNTMTYPECVVSENENQGENQEENQFQSTMNSINEKLVCEDSASSSDVIIEIEDDVETNIARNTNTLIKKTAIVISSDEEDLQDKQKRVGEQKRSRVAKRVELPDIDEVRRVNSSILTAQVEPIRARVKPVRAQAVPTTAASAPEDRSIPSKAPSESNPVSSEPNDVLTVGSDDESPVSEVEELPSVEEVKQMIQELSKRMLVLVCCSARRHRYENDARLLKGEPAVDIHTHRSGQCACCCRHAVRAPAPPPLGDELRALRDHIVQIFKVIPINPNAETRTRAPNKTKSTSTKKSKPISSRTTSTSSVTYICSDTENNKGTSVTHKDDDNIKEKSNQTKENSQETKEGCIKTKEYSTKTKESSNKTKESGNKTKDNVIKTKDSGIETKQSGIKTKKSGNKTKKSGNKTKETCNKIKKGFIKTNESANQSKDTSTPDNCHCLVDYKVTRNNPLSKAARAMSKTCKGDKTKKRSIPNLCHCITDGKPRKRVKTTNKDISETRDTSKGYEEWMRQKNINSFYFKPKTKETNKTVSTQINLSHSTTDEKTQQPVNSTDKDISKTKQIDKDYEEWVRQKNINSFYFKKKPIAPIIPATTTTSGAVSIERVKINTPANVAKTLVRLAPTTYNQTNLLSEDDVIDRAKNLCQYNSDPEIVSEQIQTIPNALQNTSSVLNNMIATRDIGVTTIVSPPTQIKPLSKQIAPKHKITIHKSILKDNRSLLKVTSGNTSAATNNTVKPQAGSAGSSGSVATPMQYYLLRSSNSTQKVATPNVLKFVEKDQVFTARRRIPEHIQRNVVLVDKDDNMLIRNSETNEIVNQAQVVSPYAKRHVVNKRAIVQFPHTRDKADKNQSSSELIVLSDDDD